MRKIIILLMLAITMSIPIASADMINTLDMKVNDYNENTKYVPSYLKSLLGDEVIKLVLVEDDGEESYIELITENAYIMSFREIDKETESDTTMVIVTSEEVVESILESDTPLKTALDAKDNKEIIIEPVGIVNNVTYTVAKGVLKVSQLLDLV